MTLWISISLTLGLRFDFRGLKLALTLLGPLARASLAWIQRATISMSVDDTGGAGSGSAPGNFSLSSLPAS